MATPNAPNPYGNPGQLGTVHQHHNGTTMAGQTHLTRAWDAKERMQGLRGHNLISDFGRKPAHGDEDMSIHPSTPTRGGTRRRRRTKHGGAQVVPRTPERPVRPLVTPNAPPRDRETTAPTNTVAPIMLFPSIRQSRNRRPAQGGASLKCGTNAVKQKDARGKVSCARCGRNHVKMWDRRANTYYCGFDSEAYDKRIKARRLIGGKKTKRAKRSSKKTRRTHKKRRTQHKRR